MASAVDGRRKAVMKLGSGDGPLSVRGRPSTVKGHPKILSNRYAESIFGTHPLSVGASAPLRSETKGQVEGCPDGTRAIPCKLQHTDRTLSIDLRVRRPEVCLLRPIGG